MVEFVHLNMDIPEHNAARQEYNVRGRSEYALYAADGEEFRRWFGLLDSGILEAAIENNLN